MATEPGNEEASKAKSAPLTEDDITLLTMEAVAREETEQQAARRIFKSGLIPATRSLVDIAMYSDNEHLRFKAATYVIERGLGLLKDSVAEDADDPMVKLARDLEANSKAILADIVSGKPTSDKGALDAYMEIIESEAGDREGD